MPTIYCPVCTARYSSKYTSPGDLLTHLTAVHPTDPETVSRVNRSRTATYGQGDVGKVKAPEVK